MTNRRKTVFDWQLEHYATIGSEYGKKHFTEAKGDFTQWILGKIAEVHLDARSIAEIGAGTCIFASLLGKRLGVVEPVVCFEPVSQLLETANVYENVAPRNGGALEFIEECAACRFDLVFTKDTAHHFPTDTLDEIHRGICETLVPGGRYLMVVRAAPQSEDVPVGSIAAERWKSLYTSTESLLNSMRVVDGWNEVSCTKWEKRIETPTQEWLDGIARRDTWSVFSMLTEAEIASTLVELRSRFYAQETFGFMHRYDVAVFEKQE